MKKELKPTVVFLCTILIAILAPDTLVNAQGEPFVGEIKMVAFNFAPRGWALCDGQLLSISNNSALFSLLGTTYGGDGITTFALPDLRGRIPIHSGQGPNLSSRELGQAGGEEETLLSIPQLPPHSHTAMASSSRANTRTPEGSVVSPAVLPLRLYNSGSANVAMGPDAITTTGEGAPVPIMPPFLTVNYIIALQGIYPSRN